MSNETMASGADDAAAPDAGSTAREDLLRGCWYAHDARWFACVMEAYGLEVANAINRRALRAQGKAEARRLVAALGLAPVTTVEEFARFVEVASRLLIPRPDMQFELRVVDERRYEIALTRCFIAENIARAGIDGGYVCAVFHRIQGWHEGVGLPLTEHPAALPCAKTRGRPCRRTLAIR